MPSWSINTEQFQPRPVLAEKTPQDISPLQDLEFKAATKVIGGDMGISRGMLPEIQTLISPVNKTAVYSIVTDNVVWLNTATGNLADDSLVNDAVKTGDFTQIAPGLDVNQFLFVESQNPLVDDPSVWFEEQTKDWNQKEKQGYIPLFTKNDSTIVFVNINNDEVLKSFLGIEPNKSNTFLPVLAVLAGSYFLIK